MALLTPQNLPSQYSPDGAVLNLVAGELTGDEWVATPDDLLVVHNSDSVTRNITLTSVPDPVTGRTGDINRALAAGEIWTYRFTQKGWAAVDNRIDVTVDNVAVQLGVLRLQS